MMKNEIFVSQFHPIFPTHHLAQEDTLNWLLKAHVRTEELLHGEVSDKDFERRLRRYCLGPQYISKRFYECDDIDQDWEVHRIYKLDPSTPQGVGLGERNKFFTERALEILQRTYLDEVPDHLVHVTCTGYASPSAPQRYFSGRGRTVPITHAYHMGCYASLPSIRLAAGISHREEILVDILHTEMCSLHLNPALQTPEQMVVESLFADGHIRYSVGPGRRGFKILTVCEKLIPDTEDDMTWVPDQFGMRMTLSKNVPVAIKDHLPSFLFELAKACGVSPSELIEKAHFAIHPGGPKIIEGIQQKLELQNSQVEMSRRVLHERGNMSSATLPHVWHGLWEAPEVKSSDLIVSLAFGPGLTIFGAIFEVQR